MSQTARDVMQTQVVTLAPETPLSSVQRLFYEESIHGAPVVDEQGRVVGMLSSADLLRAAAEEHDVAPGEPASFQNDLDLSHEEWERAPADLAKRIGAERTVADAMSTGVVNVPQDAKVAEVARRMRDHHIHRVVVVDGDKLSGVISSFDLIQVLCDD